MYTTLWKVQAFELFVDDSFDAIHSQCCHEITEPLVLFMSYVAPSWMPVARFIGIPLPPKKKCNEYCWWLKSCTTKDDKYPIIYRVLYIPGGCLGFHPGRVPHRQACQWPPILPYLRPLRPQRNGWSSNNRSHHEGAKKKERRQQLLPGSLT